jgi:hypothetical protein
MAASTGVAGEDNVVGLQDEAIRLFRSRGDRMAELVMLNNAGYWALCRGEPARARSLLEEGLAAAEHVGSRLTHASIIANLGLTDLLDGDLAEAGRHLGDAVLLAQKFGDTSIVREAIIAVSAIAALRGECEFAVRMAAAAVSCLPDSRPFEAEALLNERYLKPLVFAIDGARHQAATAEGRRWSLERAVDAAVKAARSSPQADSPAATTSEPRGDPVP